MTTQIPRTKPTNEELQETLAYYDSKMNVTTFEPKPQKKDSICCNCITITANMISELSGFDFTFMQF